MSNLLTPEDVECRAKAAGISIDDVCKRAEIARTTFMRWKTGATSPTLRVYSRIETVLTDAEAARAA